VQSGQTSERYRLERAFIAAMGGLLFPITAKVGAPTTETSLHRRVT
jgi:hypothetical protein